jgi:MraZ protein
MGEYQYNSDDKGRVMIPVKFRDELGSLFNLTCGLNHGFFGYALKEWYLL